MKLYNILIFRLALALNKHGLKSRSWPTNCLQSTFLST